MVPREVIAYVQRLRDNGYSAQAIRQNLVSSGYTSQEADQALLAVFRPAVTQQRNWKPLAAGGIAGVLVIVLLAVLFIPSSPAFSVTTRPASVEARAGSTLSFSEQFVFEKPLDGELTLTHELVAPATGNLLTSVDQQAPVAPTVTSKLALPDDLQPGRYIVHTLVTAEGHTAESSFSFKVLPALSATTPSVTPETTETPTIEPTTSQECNDFDPCTDDTFKEGTCVFETLPVCCGDYVCNSQLSETSATCPRDCAAQPEAKSTADILAEAEQTAANDAARAELLCSTLAQTSDADQCYDSVARISSHSSTCSKIVDSKTKDSCYLYFAINKDEFTVCTSITDPNLQSSCYSFKNLKEIQPPA
ncbi:MAG TPA: hypothetical protein VLJ21_00700 [Candidatus Binatia bacterium]|nr:hypothetical protein [Candidatus Binatia bacterium]